MKNISLKLILFFGLFLVLSCGTRNTKKTEIKETVNSEIDLKTEENKTSQVQTETDKTTETKKEAAADVKESNENLEPIDSEKPIVKTETEKDGVKTTTWQNAKINNSSKTDNSKTNESSSSKEKISENKNTSQSNKSDLNIKAESNKSDESKVTQSDNGFSLSWWCWLLLIAFVLWQLYKARDNGR